MILIEDTTASPPVVKLYTYNMSHKYTFTNSFVEKDIDNGWYNIVSYVERYYFARFPMNETAHIEIAPETAAFIHQI